MARLERDLPATLFYHSLWHTHEEVAQRAAWLADREGLSAEARVLVSTAAYFHDIGFLRQRKAHEVAGAQIAAEVLPHFGYRPPQVQVIRGIILATRIPQAPRNLLEEIVADADLDVLGREDFLRRNRLLRKELAADELVLSDEAWYTRQVCFVQQHHFFTPTARRERARAKERNRQRLLALLVDACPAYRGTPAGRRNHAPSPSPSSGGSGNWM